jgi:polysaccharide pyruvyl transferase
MLEPLDVWNPFDLLLERDSSAGSRPDLTFLTAAPRVPVVGVVLIDNQQEYGDRDRHRAANAAIHRLVASRSMAAVPIDTRLDENKTGLRSPEEVESLIARMDVVLTTRLHGTVLALKNGVPAVVIDPVAGGAKIRRQVEHLGWPVALASENLTDAALSAAFEYCLKPAARAKAQDCAERAATALRSVRDRFLAYMATV